jgi:hypothetical protein
LNSAADAGLGRPDAVPRRRAPDACQGARTAAATFRRDCGLTDGWPSRLALPANLF